MHLQQTIEHKDAAFAVVLSARHRQGVFDREDNRDCPYRQRDCAEHIVGHRSFAGRTEKDLVKRIERPSADIAIDDADRADRQRRRGIGRCFWPRPGPLNRDGALDWFTISNLETPLTVSPVNR